MAKGLQNKAPSCEMSRIEHWAKAASRDTVTHASTQAPPIPASMTSSQVHAEIDEMHNHMLQVVDEKGCVMEQLFNAKSNALNEKIEQQCYNMESKLN